MTDPMTQRELDEIRERAEKATPGAWEVGHASIWARINGALTRIFAICGSRKWEPDAQFIAHARTDIPALLSEADRLRDENERLRAMMVKVLRGEISPCDACARIPEKCRPDCPQDVPCDYYEIDDRVPTNTPPVGTTGDEARGGGEGA